METLFLNINNIEKNTKNSKLTYKFPNGLNVSKKGRIALKQLSMYYSWFNINNSLYQNNTFSYKWWDSNGDLTETHAITIPNGNYSIQTLNEYLQQQFLNKKHYITTVIDNKQANLFFIELTDNAIQYKFQVNFYYMPTAAEIIQTDGNGNIISGVYNYTKPTGATWNYPSTGGTTQLIIHSSGSFYKLLGFSPGVYPDTVQNKTERITGDLIPQIDFISAIYLTCNLVTQKYSYPDNILDSFINRAVFGGILNREPTQYSWANVNPGTYQNLTIQFFDQDFNQIEILDPQINVALILDIPDDEE